MAKDYNLASRFVTRFVLLFRGARGIGGKSWRSFVRNRMMAVESMGAVDVTSRRSFMRNQTMTVEAMGDVERCR